MVPFVCVTRAGNTRNLIVSLYVFYQSEIYCWRGLSWGFWCRMEGRRGLSALPTCSSNGSRPFFSGPSPQHHSYFYMISTFLPIIFEMTEKSIGLCWIQFWKILRKRIMWWFLKNSKEYLVQFGLLNSYAISIYDLIPWNVDLAPSIPKL